MKLAVRIDYWTDFVGVFDPGKVVELVKRAFPETVVDPTDHQAEKLAREMDHFRQLPETQRETMIRQATRNARDNGPTFRFEIPTDVGPIVGYARRYSVTFDLPEGAGAEIRDRLEAFLKGLNLGEPEWDA